jgi:hypothetical protein
MAYNLFFGKCGKTLAVLDRFGAHQRVCFGAGPKLALCSQTVWKSLAPRKLTQVLPVQYVLAAHAETNLFGSVDFPSQ